MKQLPLRKQTLALIAVLVPLLALFVYVALRSGPLAPVSVVLSTVANKSLAPALFGVGTLEARYSYKIGPTAPGRVKRLLVQVGERVKAGQLLGEMDPVDLDARIRAQHAALKQADAQLREARAGREYAATQALRYEQLLKVRSTSEELSGAKQKELLVAEAGVTAAQEQLSRIRAELKALEAQRGDLSLVAPVDGLVVSRDAEPGSTVVAGEAVVELIDPETVWVNARFDQIRARGLAAGLPARIVLRSQAQQWRAGRVSRLEPLADAVTEEAVAKVVLDELPHPLPPVGELAEVTVTLPALPPGPAIPNAAVRHVGGRVGVWRVTEGELRFTPVSLGQADLDGHVQVREGLRAGDQVVVYSENALKEKSSIRIVERLPEGRR